MEWTADQIRQRRRAAKLSTTELSHLIDASRSAIEKWESGHRRPRGENIAALDRVLGDHTAEPVPLSNADLFTELARLQAEALRRLAAIDKAAVDTTTAEEIAERLPGTYVARSADAPSAARKTQYRG